MSSLDQLLPVLLGLLSVCALIAAIARSRWVSTKQGVSSGPDSDLDDGDEDQDLIAIDYEWIDEPLRASEILGLAPVGRHPPLAKVPPFLAVFTANRQSHSADFNDPVEFDQIFRDISDGRIASVLLIFEHDKGQVERFLLAHEIDLPALIGASSELDSPLTHYQGNRHFGQMVVVDTASGRAVVRVLVANRGLGPVPVASKKALVEKILKR